jgi:squalene cyclase
VNNSLIINAIRSALDYLLSHQQSDGHWEEYSLPVGRTDAWVTGYIGFTLTEGESLVDGHNFIKSAIRAAEWLNINRAYQAGWGYNSNTGADADSTAWVLRLFQSVRKTLNDGDIAFILSKQCPNGGFSTYDGPDYWGDAHPDVTPNVFLSLPSFQQNAIKQQIVNYTLSSRSEDGTWPSYWWRTCHYSTLLNLEMLALLDIHNQLQLPVVRDDETHAVHSDFDLACVIGIAALQQAGKLVVNSLVKTLLLKQKKDGSWQGAANLRVTHPNCKNPWLYSEGQFYSDLASLITTATAVRALVLVIKDSQ